MMNRRSIRKDSVQATFRKSIATGWLLVSTLAHSQTQPAPVLPVGQSAVSAHDPAALFRHPPESAKPGVLWMWMGANLSKAGITKDLEALKKEGFNRTTMFSLADVTTPWACEIGKDPTPEIISWTEPWWKLVRHAAEESKRLGMDFGMFNGPSYESSGGVWITSELSMQEICSSQTKITGNQNVTIRLARPTVKFRGHTPYPVYNPKTGLVEIPAGLLQPKNQVVVEVTNVWANRLIGDEQEPADQTWLPGHLDKNSGYLKEFPDWFLNKQPRPSPGRYCFTTWKYFTKDSPLVPSGLLGPVSLIKE